MSYLVLLARLACSSVLEICEGAELYQSFHYDLCWNTINTFLLLILITHLSVLFFSLLLCKIYIMPWRHEAFFLSCLSLEQSLDKIRDKKITETKKPKPKQILACLELMTIGDHVKELKWCKTISPMSQQAVYSHIFTPNKSQKLII